MLVFEGPMPAIEDKNPQFGAVLGKLNHILLVQENQTGGFNNFINEGIAEVNALVTEFLAGEITQVIPHLDQHGIVHGESVETIGLDKVDNYPTASQAVHDALLSEESFVTPEGSSNTVLNALQGFAEGEYQQQGVLRLGGFFNPDVFNTSPPSTPQPTKYYPGNQPVRMAFMGDRLLLQPRLDVARYTKQSNFITNPVKSEAFETTQEVVDVNAIYLPNGWNQVAVDVTTGGVNFFRGLADKKIYNYKSELGLLTGRGNYLPYSKTSPEMEKGIAVSANWANANQQGLERITLDHRAYYVANPTTDPTLKPLVGDTYPATFNKGDGNPTGGFLNGSHTLYVADLLDAPANTRFTLNPKYTGGVSLYWDLPDQRLRLTVIIPIIATKGGVSKALNLQLTELLTPGTLANGGSASFNLVWNGIKDVLDETLTPAIGNKLFTLTDEKDPQDPAVGTGVFLPDGRMVKAIGTKYGIRVKAYQTEYTSLLSLFENRQGKGDPKKVNTTVIAPGRANSFGSIPERVFAVDNASGNLTYLTHQLDSATGRYGWFDLEWDVKDAGSPLVGTVFGVSPPARMIRNTAISEFPGGVISMVNTRNQVNELSAMAFSTQNRYKGYSGFSYKDGKASLGSPVALESRSRVLLTLASHAFRKRARAANPTVNDALREIQIFVYSVGDRALVVMTDGLNYAEGAVGGGYLEGNQFILVKVQNLGFTVLTPPGTSFTGTSRKSLSNDNVWISHSDLKVFKDETDYTFVLDRPFGDVYGDLSFKVLNLRTNPLFELGRVNPAKLYQGDTQFDVVEELYPSVAIPGKGVFQYDPTGGNFQTRMKSVSGEVTFDPYEPKTTGWVTLGAGTRVILNGRSYLLSNNYSVQVTARGVNYCYLKWTPRGLLAVTSSTKLETSNHLILFGVVTNGVLRTVKDYVVLDNHVISETREGSAIPAFADNGGEGTNQFFTQRDF